MCWFIELRFVKIRSQKEQGNFLPKCKESLWAWKQKVEKLKTLIVATIDWVFSPLNLISVRNFCRSQGTEISQLLQYASPFYAQIWGWTEGKKVLLFKVSVGWREMKVTGNGHWILLDTFWTDSGWSVQWIVYQNRPAWGKPLKERRGAPSVHSLQSVKSTIASETSSAITQSSSSRHWRHFSSTRPPPNKPLMRWRSPASPPCSLC